MTDAGRWLDVRVEEILPLTPAIKQFRLAPVAGAALPVYSGGSYILVEMQDGSPVRHNAYSLVWNPAPTRQYTIAVRRDANGRGGSRFLHDQLRQGMHLKISAPVNMFPLDLRARKHLLIAGGIGITPITAMIDQLCDSAQGNADFELHYAGRSPEHTVFAKQLSMRLGARVKFYYSNQEQRIPLVELLANQPLGTHLYACGPPRMTEEIRSLASEIGWPEAHLHQELFQSPAVGKPFQLHLAKSQLTVTVAADQSMLEAMEGAGVEAPYMCRGGACGQCEMRVVACDGILLHADHYLTESEKASGKKVMPCVSRFEGAALVLDL